MTVKPEQTLAWMARRHRRLLADVAALPDQALAAATALPGWTRRYLLAHVAANAGALRNLVHWARTGEERRMYSNDRERDADIAAGAGAPGGRDWRAWTESSARDPRRRPGARCRRRAWNAKVITAQGLTRSPGEIPWMRVREVYMHAIDLGAGTGWTDLPAEFLAVLLDDVTARRSAKGGGPALAVAATDTGHAWEVAGPGRPGPGERPPRRPGRLPDRPRGPRAAVRPRPPRLAVTPSQRPARAPYECALP